MATGESADCGFGYRNADPPFAAGCRRAAMPLEQPIERRCFVHNLKSMAPVLVEGEQVDAQS